MTGDSHIEKSDFTIGSNSGNIGAVGPGATGSISIGSPAPELVELQRRLGELKELVERYTSELEDSETARHAVAEAEKEARSGNPQPGRLRMLLSAITGAASGVTAVTTAVRGIRDLLVAMA